MSALFQIGEQAFTAAEIVKLLSRHQLIPQIMNCLVVDQAIADFECTAEERESAIKAFEAHYGLETPEQKQAWRNSFGMGQEEYEAFILRPTLLNKFKVANWDAKVESYFLTRKASLDKVLYSLIRVRDLGTAQELFFRINEGEESFADIARAYSQGKEADTGGLVGPAPLSNPHPVIAKTLAVSQPGQLWPPIKIEDWYIIIRLEKFFPAQLDEATRSQMIDELFNTWLREQLMQVGSSIKVINDESQDVQSQNTVLAHT